MTDGTNAWMEGNATNMVSNRTWVPQLQGRQVLDQVTFSVPGGEVFGLVGLNGAGSAATRVRGMR